MIELAQNTDEFRQENWNGEGRQDLWSIPGTYIDRLIEQISPRLKPDVLDLGCGIGRNSVAFARAGFRVTAADPSLSAIACVRQWAENERHFIRTASFDFSKNFFLAESFDIVVCANALYHGTRDHLEKAIGNIRRWLKPKGLCYFTCPTLQDGRYGKGDLIEPETYELEPGHVHFYPEKEDLAAYLFGFRIVSMRKHECLWHDSDSSSHRLSSRWQVLAEKI